MNEPTSRTYTIYKVALDIVLVIFTAGMMLATAWQAYETKLLGKADIGPNISLADVGTTFIDNKDIEVRKTSWTNGELFKSKNSFDAQVEKVNQGLKFSNTGKNAGYIKLLSQKTSASYSVFNYERNDQDIYYLVPALGQTGETYVFDLENALDLALKRGDKYFQIDYQIETFDINKISQGILDISIYCSMNVRKIIEVECVPFNK